MVKAGRPDSCKPINHMNSQDRIGNRFLSAPKGTREKILRAFGAGDLYDRLTRLSSEAAEARHLLAETLAERSKILNQLAALQQETAEKLDALNTERDVLKQAASDLQAERDQLLTQLRSRDERLSHFDGMAGSHRLIELDFPITPKVRHGWGKPADARLEALIAKGHARYAEHIKGFAPVFETIAKIKPHPDGPADPHWVNDWLPVFDALSIYGKLAVSNPPLYLEIGSGTSTKFARRAIQDFGLRTRIVSIDPFPRAEVDAICDEVVRLPLEAAPAEAYSIAAPDTVMFFDGSHRSFQNSDVTVFFTEMLPSMPAGMQIGVHDVFLPWDYPEAWLKRHYSEQYLLACWLLAGDRVQIELPVHYCSNKPDLRALLHPLFGASNLKGHEIHGGAFWFSLRVPS